MSACRAGMQTGLGGDQRECSEGKRLGSRELTIGVSFVVLRATSGLPIGALNFQEMQNHKEYGRLPLSREATID